MSNSSHTISYKYDDSGIRTQKVVDGVTTNYHLVGDKVSYEDNGTDKIYYTYDSSNDLVSMNLNGTEYYYIRNAQGDIIGLFDSTGTQVVSYTYDTWGKLILTTGSLSSTVGVKNPYRYRGYRYDNETQLYYLQSRYYNPEWGRFINADAITGKTGEILTYNAFEYCRNNPVNNFDLNGFWTFQIGLGGSIGAGIGVQGEGGLCVGSSGVSFYLNKGGLGCSSMIGFGVNLTRTNAKKNTDLRGNSVVAGVGYSVVSCGVVVGSNYSGKSLGVFKYTPKSPAKGSVYSGMTYTDMWDAREFVNSVGKYLKNRLRKH